MCNDSSLWFLICASLMANDVEYLFMYLFAIPIRYVFICHPYTFFSKFSLYIFCPLYNWVVGLLLMFESSTYILDTSPYSDMWFATIFSYSESCLFIFYQVLLQNIIVNFY